jgi:hypothetical protein
MGECQHRRDEYECEPMTDHDQLQEAVYVHTGSDRSENSDHNQKRKRIRDSGAAKTVHGG